MLLDRPEATRSPPLGHSPTADKSQQDHRLCRQFLPLQNRLSPHHADAHQHRSATRFQLDSKRLYFEEIPIALVNSLESQPKYQNHGGETEHSHPKPNPGP